MPGKNVITSTFHLPHHLTTQMIDTGIKKLNESTKIKEKKAKTSSTLSMAKLTHVLKLMERYSVTTLVINGVEIHRPALTVSPLSQKELPVADHFDDLETRLMNLGRELK